METYKRYEYVQDFMKDIIDNIDMSRQILIFGEHKNLTKIKATVFKKIVDKNFQYFVGNCTQRGNEIRLNFTSFDCRCIIQVADFFCLAVSVRSFGNCPVIVLFYFSPDGMPFYMIPINGNTVNPVTLQPFGTNDAIDSEISQSFCGKTMAEIRKEKSFNAEKIMSDVISDLNLPSHSEIVKHSVNVNVGSFCGFAEENRKFI